MTKLKIGAQLLCPSSRCEPGAILLGSVKDDGSVGHIPMRLRIDKNFVDEANADGKAETRFRFASPCVKSACTQWENGGCGIVKDVTEAPQSAELNLAKNLPSCSIRKDCRWFNERRAAACRVCTFVITDDDASSANYVKYHSEA